MNLAQKIVVAACLGFMLGAPAAGAETWLQAQISQHEKNLAQARSANDQRSLGTELNTLASFYRMAGNPQKALDYCNQALAFERLPTSQATTKTIQGRIYTDLGQEPKALDLFNEALPVWRQAGNRLAEANTLSYMGRAYNNLGQRDDALKSLNQSLAIWHVLEKQGQGLSALAGGRSGEAITLDNLGETYWDMSQNKQALEYFTQALPLWHDAGQPDGEALTLNGMGRAYADLGQKQKALEDFNQALSEWRELGNRQGEGLTLNNMGRLLRDLGEQQTALDYYNQALPIWRDTGNLSGEALALNDIGRAYADMGQSRKALDYAEQALPLWRKAGNRQGEANTLNNIGKEHSDLGEPDKALDYDLQALSLWHEVKNQRGEAVALMTMAWAYAALKQPEKSLASQLTALSLATAAGDPELQGAMQTSLMLGFRNQHLPEQAIFFGLAAVNSYQEIRKNISGLDKDLQAGFVESKARTYRVLAELLVQAGRLGEAEQVLDLLKEQELQDVVRGAAPGSAAGIEPLKLTAGQQKAQAELLALGAKSLALEDSNIQYALLQNKAKRTPAEDAQLNSLGTGIEKEQADTQAFFATTFPADLQQAGPAGSEDATQSYLQSTLAKLGPRVMGIRLLLGEDHAYAIVVTSTTRKKVELKATPADLRTQALATLQAMDSRASDPRPQLAKLYAMVVAPLEDDLKALETPPGPQGHVPTLLWSLDDVMRYLPMAALYDGQYYLVERFKNVLFTPESYGHMTDSPLLSGAKPSVLAMGLSRSYGGLPALPGVMPELDAVVRDPSAPDSHGPMQGKLLPNDQFTLAALKTELTPGQNFSVVHIASHFVVETGSGEEPFLMMGGESSGDPKGYEWNLSDMENSPIAFKGTRLLTLSACSTAKDYKSRNGLEMDSLGMVAQQKDAEAVLATMWDVNDASTSRIMSDFYTRWVNHPGDGKAEALRQAQLALMRGPAASSQAGTGRGVQTVEDSAVPPVQDAGYSLPYYWAPFVLIGNYQ